MPIACGPRPIACSVQTLCLHPIVAQASLPVLHSYRSLGPRFHIPHSTFPDPWYRRPYLFLGRHSETTLLGTSIATPKTYINGYMILTLGLFEFLPIFNIPA